jgi:hypothetical protein
MQLPAWPAWPAKAAMANSNLTTYPAAVRAQLTDLLDIVAALLGQNLVGLYATRPSSSADRSVLPLVVVTARDVRRDTKLGLLQALLRRSLQPAALEVLVVRQADLLSPDPSLLLQLHFAEGARPQFAADTASLMWLSWPDGPSGAIDRDPVVRQLRQDALTLAGPALPTLLPPASARAAPPGRGRQLGLDHYRAAAAEPD